MLARGYATAMDVAGLLGINVTSVYRMADRGTLTTLRVGRAWYVELDSLTKYIRNAGPGRTDIQLLAQVEVLKKKGRDLASTRPT